MCLEQAARLARTARRLMNATALLLSVALRQGVSGPNLEAGFERFSALTGGFVGYGAFCDAVAACLRDHLIREPIRLPEGALQCHWHLELTPAGVEAARQLPEVKQSVQNFRTLCKNC